MEKLFVGEANVRLNKTDLVEQLSAGGANVRLHQHRAIRGANVR